MGRGTHVQLLTIQLVTSSDTPDSQTLKYTPRPGASYIYFV